MPTNLVIIGETAKLWTCNRPKVGGFGPSGRQRRDVPRTEARVPGSFGPVLGRAIPHPPQSREKPVPKAPQDPKGSKDSKDHIRPKIKKGLRPFGHNPRYSANAYALLGIGFPWLFQPFQDIEQFIVGTK